LGKEKGFGLGLLSPQLRLAVVFTSGVLFIFVNSIIGATILFVLGLALFLANEKRNWKLALSAPLSGGMMFLYNVILSPPEYGGMHWFVFTVNQAGVDRGLVTGLRLLGAMLISFAWLDSTPIPDMYQGIAWFRFGEAWALQILRGIQILKREFVALTQSLIIRGLRWDSVWANIRNLVPLATVIIPRVVENAQKSTLAGQSHRRITSKGDGSITARDLFVRYSCQLPDVLHGISLEIGSGEFVYLAGKSAAGKTTLLRALGGVIPWIMGEFRGKVFVSGMLTHETSLATLCGTARYVAPDPFASIHGLTVGQEISFLSRDKRSAREALAVMGIDHLWNRETTKLSGGQQVRLVLAGALVSEAKILLLDSPMQELDPEGRVAFMEALAILRSERPCTIVVCDPFWSELIAYTDRVIVLEEGRIVQDLAPVSFFTKEWLSRCNLERVALEVTPPSSGNVLAEMQGVCVSLEGNEVLKDVSLTLREGELVVVMGPNGSGKTTSLLTLSGAIAPTRGAVKTVGRVGYVFQNPSLQVVTMTVREELAFGPGILAWSDERSNAFVESGLEWTGLSPLACPLDLHPAMVRMLTVAACNTDLSALILDEPTVGLDTKGIQKVMGLVSGMVEKGKAVVIITHDEEVARRASRVVVIDGGRVAFDGPSGERPSSRPRR